MLREIRCHSPKCKNTFLAEHGWRRLCDACRVARYVIAQQKIREKNKKSPAWHQHKNVYQKNYRKDRGEDLRAYNREWMRRKRAGLPTRIKGMPKAQKPVLEPDSVFKRCFKCAYWMNRNWAICPQCGEFNK
jgi:hypothetical protein